MRLVFAGTPEFAARILDALIHSRHTVAGVLTQPDRRAGRGKGLRESAVKQRAGNAGLDLSQPERLDATACEWLARREPDCLVVAAYGLLLPKAVLELPPLGCINVHASLLPRWRGAAPIQRAIEAGDAETGISIMRMERGLDTGDVYQRRALPITETDTAGSLHDDLARIGAAALLEALDGIEAGTLAPEPQNDAAATYAHKIEKCEGRIDWHADCALLARRIRAFNPWPGAWTELPSERVRKGSARLRVLTARAVAGTGDREPGTVIAADAEGIRIACGDGALCLTEVQRAGRGPVSGDALLRGLTLASGDRFE